MHKYGKLTYYLTLTSPYGAAEPVKFTLERIQLMQLFKLVFHTMTWLRLQSFTPDRMKNICSLPNADDIIIIIGVIFTFKMKVFFFVYSQWSASSLNFGQGMCLTDHGMHKPQREEIASDYRRVLPFPLCHWIPLIRSPTALVTGELTDSSLHYTFNLTKVKFITLH